MTNRQLEEFHQLQDRVDELEAVVTAIREAVAGTAIGARIDHALKGVTEART